MLDQSARLWPEHVTDSPIYYYLLFSYITRSIIKAQNNNSLNFFFQEFASPELTQNRTNKKHLSTIMETTETNTISSTKSVSSSPEVDYDTIISPKPISKILPKINLETITENSNELSLKRPEIPFLNISSPGIPSNKVSEAICMSLYTVLPEETINVTKSFIKKPALVDTDEIMDFFTTTPENKRNKFSSSQKKSNFNESITCPSETCFVPRKLGAQENVSVLPSFSDLSKFENTELLTEPILLKSSKIVKNVSILPSFADMLKLDVIEPIQLKAKNTFADSSKFDNITESNFKLNQITGNSTKIQNLDESLLKPCDNQKSRSFYQQSSQPECEDSLKFDFSLKKEQSISINDNLPIKHKSILDSFREIQNLSIKAEDLSIDILIDGEDFDQDEFGKSIYISKSPIKQIKLLTDEWDELNSDSKSSGNFYHPEVDLNETQHRLNLFVNSKIINPFDTNLCDTLLEKVDFYTFLKDEVPSCTMIDKVHPLKVNSVVQIGKENFQIYTLIGKGAFGKVFR